MTQSEAERFTAALYEIVERDFWGAGAAAAARRPVLTTASVRARRIGLTRDSSPSRAACG